MAISSFDRAARVEECAGVAVGRCVLAASPLHCGWSLDALTGRFVEMVGGADSGALTTAVSLVLEVQRRGEFAAWISCRGSCFYPPDLAASGVDLDALPVIRAGARAQGCAAESRDAARAADVLLRSKSFRLVVVDVGHLRGFSLSMQTRLVGLAVKASAVLLCISEESGEGARGGGSLVSFRGKVEKRKTGHDCFECEVTAMKDKRGRPGWVHKELYRGPDGLC